MRDGILNHTGAGLPSTLEGGIVRLADRFAYVNHDIDDALRAGILDSGSCRRSRSRCWATPRRSGSMRSCTTWSSTRRRPARCVQSQPMADALLELRAFMFENIYLGPIARRENVVPRPTWWRRCSCTTSQPPTTSR